MSDMARGEQAGELAAALRDAQVLVEEYAGYDEHAARRRIARRVVADETRQKSGARPGPVSEGQLVVPAPLTAPVADALVLDAACHVRAACGLDLLAWRLVTDRAFTQRALDADTWPHGSQAALLFGALLHLGGLLEQAQFWFQYAAGADSHAAARCLYLLHLSRAEVKTAQHWKRQMQQMAPDPGLPVLPPLPVALEGTLGASVIWTSPPITTQDLTFLPPPSGLGLPGTAGQPRRHLPDGLQKAVTALTAQEDDDLGEVLRPSPRLAIALRLFHQVTPPAAHSASCAVC
ncbi:hypothetical protein [Streptomyces melanogenes]|uniref:hypothetical protein n=1 Tax=Streptomyces melanogenes TaxID=67326 RepID=UPI00378E4904